MSGVDAPAPKSAPVWQITIASDAMPVTDAREQAYIDYQNRIQNAWRDGR